MHIACCCELARAEGVRGLDDSAAPAGSWHCGKVSRASKVCAHKSLRCMQLIASAETSLSHPW